ncbi:hypothetical protein ACTJJE_15150 [Mycolicibacterium sp. 22603]|uniref:hypothetical protein n=1 Tax=Mycolicibacterium sp. 22603 TaxID=3453950 RepID=UPI003F827D83
MSDQSEGYQRRTSVLAVASSLVTAATLFAIFRFTADYTSVEWIGVWSLLQGLFLVARVADSGAGTNISRVLAVRVKNCEPIDLRNTTVAALLITSLPSLLLAAVIAPGVGFYVTAIYGDKLTGEVLWTLVWLALLSASLAAVANVLLAICEGLFELNYKSFAVISGNLVGLSTLIPLLTVAGPAGVGWVYVVIFGTQLLLGGLRLLRLMGQPSPPPQAPVREHVQILWRENLQLSGIALIRLSFEPATKLLLSLFAPLVVIAQFELALRVTTQLRIVIQSALQPLLVIGARMHHRPYGEAHTVFLKNDRALWSLSLGGLIAQILAAPAIQWLGLGFHSDLFTVFFAMLAAGNAVNTIGLSGYYWQLTSGSLMPLVRVQSAMAVWNIGVGILGLVLGSATTVVAAYCGAFALGGLVSRSFLRGLAGSSRFLSPLLIVLGGSIATGVVVIVDPVTLRSVTIFLCFAALVAGLCLYFTYRTYRRSSY